MSNRKLYTKPKRVTGVIDDAVYRRLMKKADQRGESLSRLISKVLTAFAAK